MIITNLDKFNRVCKILANFCTDKYLTVKKLNPALHNVIYASGNTLYATEGHILMIVECSDCIENDVDFNFPINIKANKSIMCIGNILKIDDKEEYSFEQHRINIKGVIPTKKPTAQITFDFSDYRLDKIHYNWKNYPFVKFTDTKVSFDYRDCLFYEIEDCYSTDLLNDDFGEFEPVRFPLWQISQIMKISKKFTIQQFNKGKYARKIIADNYEFVIQPLFDYE